MAKESMSERNSNMYRLKTKAHFIDSIKADILEDQGKNEGCEICGFYHSIGEVEVTDERDNSSVDLYLCEECYSNIKFKRNRENLMNIYSVSQVARK